MLAHKKFLKIFPLHREEAHAYVLNPEKTDSKRGLKRSWVSSEEQPGPSSSSTARSKLVSSTLEKGKFSYLTRVNFLMNIK